MPKAIHIPSWRKQTKILANQIIQSMAQHVGQHSAAGGGSKSK